MSTLKDQIESDVSAVFQNTEEFAETWTQWPAGVEASAATVVVNPDFPIGQENTGTKRLTNRGDEQETNFEISVASTVAVTERDVWIDENSIQYQTVAVGPIEGSMRRLLIQRNDKDHTSRPSGGTLL